MSSLEHIFTEWIRSLWLLVRIILGALVICYATGLTCYLVLRLLFGDRFWWLALLNAFVLYIFLPLFIVLPVTLVLRQRWLLGVIASLAVVGGLWFGPYFAPKTVHAASGTTLHVITFNAWPSNPRLNDVADWLRQQNADVVLLQDSPQTYLRNGLPELLDIYPYQFVPRQNNDGIILSRHPFVTTANLGGMPTQERVVINFNGQAVAIYNIHLKQPFRGQPRVIKVANVSPFLKMALRYENDDNVRDTEIKRLIANLVNERLPFIVAGDFNMSDQSPVYGDLSAQMVDSFRETGVGLGTSWPAGGEAGWPAFVPPLIRIDYLWHSAAFRAINVQQGPKLGSDHVPLHALLELP
ncbi:MAG: endonuclease/exonuclease/phosphatase family protein [Chloroflexota bacterium]